VGGGGGGGGGGGSGGLPGIVAVPQHSAGRNPNARLLAQCLALCRTGEDTDKVLELLVLCHDHWAGIVAEFYPSGVAEPASPVMRVDLSFALRSLLLPPSTPKDNSRCVCVYVCMCVCVRVCVSCVCSGW
jgi:hypothetical protein